MIVPTDDQVHPGHALGQVPVARQPQVGEDDHQVRLGVEFRHQLPGHGYRIADAEALDVARVAGGDQFLGGQPQHRHPGSARRVEEGEGRQRQGIGRGAQIGRQQGKVDHARELAQVVLTEVHLVITHRGGGNPHLLQQLDIRPAQVQGGGGGALQQVPREEQQHRPPRVLGANRLHQAGEAGDPPDGLAGVPIRVGFQLPVEVVEMQQGQGLTRRGSQGDPEGK